MIKITFREFTHMLGYYPNKKGTTLGEFAKTLNVSLSYVSKLYNNRITDPTGRTFKKIETFVQSYGYKLYILDPVHNVITNAIKENKKLKETIAELREDIKDLQMTVHSLEKIIRMSERIVEYSNKLKEVKK